MRVFSASIVQAFGLGKKERWGLMKCLLNSRLKYMRMGFVDASTYFG